MTGGLVHDGRATDRNLIHAHPFFMNEVSPPRMGCLPTLVTTLPVVISNFEPWQGQVIIAASSVPLLSEHPRCVHLPPIA